MKLLYAVLALVIIGSATATTVYSVDYQIPSWTKNVALYWGQGELEDGEYIEFLQFLVNEEIITIPNENSDDVSQLENEVTSLEYEILSLKSSIASDLINAYDDGYSAGIASVEPVAEPEQVVEYEIVCGFGTESVNGVCEIIQTEEPEPTLDPIPLITFTNPQIVDGFGNRLDAVSVDQQIQLAADLTNGQDREQPFTFILEFKNEDGARIYFAGDNPTWITGSLSSGQSFSPALSWIPTRSGTYIAELSVTETVDDFLMNNTKLAPSLTTQIVVGDVDVVKSITIQTDSTSYVKGSDITVSGSITNYTHDDSLVVIWVYSPNGNIISIDQFHASTNGNYSTTILSGGPVWESQGDYVLKVTNGDVDVVKSIRITNN
jgi:hypothetical protein